MVVMWWLFLEKHSTVHKADDILQLVSFNKKKKKKRADDGDAPALTLWSKAATSVDTTPSLSVRSRKIRRLAVKEGEEDGMQRSSEISLDATVEGGDLCRQLTDMHPGQEWGYF